MNTRGLSREVILRPMDLNNLFTKPGQDQVDFPIVGN